MPCSVSSPFHGYFQDSVCYRLESLHSLHGTGSKRLKCSPLITFSMHCWCYFKSLHVIWTVLILRIAYNAIYADGVKDLREDSSLSEDSSSSELTPIDDAEPGQKSPGNGARCRRWFGEKKSESKQFCEEWCIKNREWWLGEKSYCQ